jgi:hypothetical protein
MYSSQIERYGGTKDSPDYVYYNANIVNSNSNDLASGLTVTDPNVQFNESRDTYIIKNSSDYYFSIIRCSLDGPNLDLPLFIPDIQSGTGQTNPNLTSYGLAISYSQSWYTSTGLIVPFTITPITRFIIYQTETKNPVLAPPPRLPSNSNYFGLYVNSVDFVPGQIVSLAFNNYGSGVPPYYVCLQPNGPSTTVQAPGAGSAFWGYQSPTDGVGEDLDSRYYWVYTYQHWLDLVNKTIYDPSEASKAPSAVFNCCMGDTFSAFYQQWLISCPTTAFPYANLGDFVQVIIPPVFTRDNSSGLFSITVDSDAFGDRILPSVSVTTLPSSPSNNPVCRLFFNTNMYGLFSNLPNTYWNTLSPTVGPFPGQVAPVGYVNEISFDRLPVSKVVDYRLPPYGGTPPLGLVPIYAQKPYWVLQQEYISTDSLWSPVGSIVFTSTLMPIQTESAGPPIDLGAGNTNFSAPTVRSAFEPIITDIVVPLGDKGAQEYRSFIYYNPTAEFRLADFTADTEIRNIDIQVFWRSRLNNVLYPIQMFNQSSVNIKFMFKKIGAGSPTKGAPPHEARGGAIPLYGSTRPW